MRVTRFFVTQPLAADGSIELSGEAAHHALKVLRLKPGDGVVIFNGQGGEYPGVVKACGRQGLQIDLAAWHDRECESPLAVTLVQAISSGDRMDYTIQKAVELGVSRIVPVMSERGVVTLTGDRIAKRRQHWQKIVVAACEQCGRNRLPEVDPIMALEEWLAANHGAGERWLLSPQAEQPLSRMSPPQAGVQILIGAEGGFSEREEAAALRHGFRSVRLGARVLRTETAGAAMLAAMQVLWGDF